jgi:hypothetical protein
VQWLAPSLAEAPAVAFVASSVTSIANISGELTHWAQTLCGSQSVAPTFSALVAPAHVGYNAPEAAVVGYRR